MRNKDRTKKEFDELLLEVRKVTRVTTGGRQMSFRSIVVVGNKKGKIGLGVAKGVDVGTSVKKASHEAYKNMFIVPLTRANTVPYILELKYKACRVRLLPASQGTGLKAGSSVRAILSLAGYENVLSKIIGSNNKLNNALTTIKALSSYKHADYFSAQLDSKQGNEKEDKIDSDSKLNTDNAELKKVENKKTDKKTSETKNKKSKKDIKGNKDTETKKKPEISEKKNSIKKEKTIKANKKTKEETEKKIVKKTNMKKSSLGNPKKKK